MHYNWQGPGVWAMTCALAGDPVGPFVGVGLELVHPRTQQISDSVGLSAAGRTEGNVTLLSADFFTSDPQGSLRGRFSECPDACRSVINSGDLQLAHEGFTTTAGRFDFYLKSDIAPIPEPSATSMVLVGMGLLAATVVTRAQRSASKVGAVPDLAHGRTGRPRRPALQR